MAIRSLSRRRISKRSSETWNHGFRRPFITACLFLMPFNLEYSPI
nr:MAG TPA: hypothetical protein [Caudoviricetes sp.]